MTETVHDLTVAEILALTARYQAERAQFVAEKIDLEAERQAGATEEVISDFEAATRERALSRLNGYAPSSLKLVKSMTRSAEIDIEIGAIDLVLSALQRKELVASATEAAQWVIQNGPAWRELCRDWLLTAERLHALETRAFAVRQELGGVTPATLELAEFIGNGRSPLGIRWDSDPLSRVRTAALQAKIITKADLEDARNA